MRNIGVFTSGGDSPGMNAAIYATVKLAIANGIGVKGIRRGYDGMIDGDFIDLDEKKLQQQMHLGGTILKTARCPRFLEKEGRKIALDKLNEANIDALVCIGGDGSFKGMLSFSEICDLPFIGIPGTIDNDLAGTDYSLGFDTALNNAIQNIDKIRDTAESHNRIFLVEVMGRDSGYIAIHSGLGTGADGILIPESEKDFIQLLYKIRHYKSEEALIVVVCEGDELGAELVSNKIMEVNPTVDLRITRLGHVQRGGNPSAFDRMLGIRFGVAAVEALINGEQNKMVGLIDNKIVLTPFEKVVKQHTINIELQKLLDIFSR